MKKNNSISSTAIWILRLTFACLFVFSTIISAHAQFMQRVRLEQHVHFLASDELQGRKAGTEHTRIAARYITSQFMEIGIEPFYNNSYMQYFWNNAFQNVVGVIRGNDPILKDEYIIIGAHYDHLGTFLGRIRNGADDNASGTAALIELGRELKRNQSNLKRSVILIAFDAEEAGLIGSTHFINRWDAPIENIKLMISLDMVGWYQATEKLEYIGIGTIRNGSELILNPQIIPEGLNAATKKFENSILTATDTFPFAANRIPTLWVTTGFKSPYHTSRDEAHLIDYDGMALIVKNLASLIETISQNENLEPSGRIARKHKPRRTIGLEVSANLSSVIRHYTTEKSNAFIGAGVIPQINFGAFAVRPELLYDHIREINPSETIITNNLTVPLSLVLQTPNHWIFGGDVFFGGYYTNCLNGKQGDIPLDFENSFNRDGFGLSFGLGYYLKPFKVGATFRIPLTDFNQSAGVNKRKISSYSVISYMF